MNSLKSVCLSCLMALFLTSPIWAQEAAPIESDAQNKILEIENVDNGMQLYSKEELKDRMSYFYKDSWEDLNELSAQNNKRFFVIFETPWCRVCKKMNHEVFARDLIRNYAEKNFLAYKLDGEERADIAKNYEINSYPVIMFFDHKGEVLEKFEGALTETLFLEKMQNHTLRPHNTKYSWFR